MNNHCSKGDLHHHESKQVLSKKQQYEIELQQLAKKMEQMEAKERHEANKKKKYLATYMDYEQKNKREKQKKQQLQYMMNAVASNEITIDQANALILKREKQENQSLVKGTTKNDKAKQFNIFLKQIVQLSEEVEKELIKELNEDRDKSPNSQTRTSRNGSPLRQHSSKRNLATKREEEPQKEETKTRLKSA